MKLLICFVLLAGLFLTNIASTKENFRSSSWLSDAVKRSLNFLHQRVKRSDDEDDTDNYVKNETSAVNAAIASTCTVECTDKMDSNIISAFPDVPIDSRSAGKTLVDKYDEKELDQICKIYVPTSSCLKKCPNSEIFKAMTLNTLKLLEFICVTNNADVRKTMPCLDKNNAPIDKVCDPKCKKYETSLDSLQAADLDDLSNKKLNDLQTLFNNSCTYIQCESPCVKPIATKACGKDASTLLDGIFSSLITSINGMVSLVNMARDDNSTVSLTPVCRQKLPTALKFTT